MFKIIGIVMTACTLFVVTYFLLKNVPIIFKRSWREPAIFED
jgi:inositol 1,4,5-triphosphate receptor type 1/inositol 1,4,5-triphosphate receptor type 3